MAEDVWASLADPFVNGAYATVKGRVRTYVLHHQLMDHLPPPPAAVLDVGGGAGHQSLPLARLGYDVVILDSSEAMLSAAEQRLAAEPADVRGRVRLVRGRGEDASSITGGRLFDAVLCHGVLMYLPDPAPMIEELCRCAAPGGVVSVLALNAATLAVRPALERRWQDARAAFGATANRSLGLGSHTVTSPAGTPTTELRRWRGTASGCSATGCHWRRATASWPGSSMWSTTRCRGDPYRGSAVCSTSSPAGSPCDTRLRRRARQRDARVRVH